MTNNESLIEALVKLTDDFSTKHKVHGPDAISVVADIHGAAIEGPDSIWSERYVSLLNEATQIIEKMTGIDTESVVWVGRLEALIDAMNAYADDAEPLITND